MPLNKAEDDKDDKSLPEKPPPTEPDPSLPAYAEASSSRFQTRFASISLHREDRLRLLSFEHDIIAACRRAIRRTWGRGIQDERIYAGSYEFKLFGHPWRGAGDEAIEARRLMYKVLATLHTRGWVMMLNTDISKHEYDKDTLLFRHQVPAPAECEWGCIAFSRENRLRFIDLPPEIHRLAASRMGRGWIQSQQLAAPGVPEIKLYGTPWRSSGKDTMNVRELLLMLLETLEDEGWSVYASIDQKSGASSYGDTDTWHCCRPKGWVKGTPVYHN